MIQFIQPTWSVPDHVHAFTTLRIGGVSQAPFDSLNLAQHVTDLPEAVTENRQILAHVAQFPNPPVYLSQIHSTRVIRLPYKGDNLDADALYTNQAKQVCLIMTADCLPVLFCNKDGTQVAAAHAGWRGLCDGILEKTVKEFDCPLNEIQVWLGPAISEKFFQIGQEVVDQFCAVDAKASEAFSPDPKTSGKFFGNLYKIACQRLNNLGITQIVACEHCTYSEPERFFSYRRDGKTGRMATVIWFD